MQSAQELKQTKVKNKLDAIRDGLLRDAGKIPCSADCKECYLEGYRNGVLDFSNHIKMGVK